MSILYGNGKMAPDKKRSAAEQKVMQLRQAKRMHTRTYLPPNSVLGGLAAIFLAVFISLRMDDTNNATSGFVPVSEHAVIDAWRQGSNDPQRNILHVDQVPFGEMTHEIFHNNYQKKHKPVILKNAYANNPLLSDTLFGWQTLHDKYGDIPLKTRVPRHLSSKGCTGAGLCQGPEITLGKLMEEHFLNTNAEDSRGNGIVNSPYPHDLSLMEVLPDMYNEYRTLSYFGENFLLAIRNGKDRWPSIFVGARGTQTGFHTDIMGTSFTMAVFRGRKQFVLMDPTEGPKLCMKNPFPGLDYGIQAFNPNFDRCPEARDARVMFASLGPSDILFVPGSYHHAAWNVENSIGVLQNLLTVDDYDSVMESMVGYVVETRREMARRPGAPMAPAGVPFDFIAMRDFYRLFATTGFVSNWRDGPMYWKAPDAVERSFDSIKTHLYRLLFTDKSQAWRPALFLCPELAHFALEMAGAYVCLSDSTRKMLEEHDSISQLDLVLDRDFQKGGGCHHLSHQWQQFRKNLEEDAPRLAVEKGLTRRHWKVA